MNRMEFMSINIITFIAINGGEVVVRECQRERMSFKHDDAGVYSYKHYEREGERERWGEGGRERERLGWSL
jgi:hypothetical protein